MAPEPEPFLGVAHSVTGRFWRPRLDDERAALTIAQRLDVPEAIGRVLAARGVTAENGEGFLNPSLRESLPDPSSLHDMDRAAGRLAEAVMTDEAVAVFGDYDVDGATSSALLSRFFAAIGGHIRIYIPDRLREGYGPNAPALRRLRDEGARVIVTVDCGTLAFEPLASAAAEGLDVIVVDHHEAEPRLPPAFAVINPNRLDESGALSQLAAVGVAFLLVVAVNRELRNRGWFDDRPEPDLKQWLDLVALGTVCDVVPLIGVNRALVRSGLTVMARRANTGLAALADVAGLSEAPGVYHAGFVFGPRINAGGRIGKADLGARLLTTNDAAEAAALARELDALNGERREIEALVLEQAKELAEHQGDRAPLVLVAGVDWHPGVIGIVASRLKETFRRPAVVVAQDGAVGKGSARSLPGIDIGAAVTAARQAGLLVDGGGHPMAAGFTVAADRIGDLGEFLEQRIGPAAAALNRAAGFGIDGALAVGGATTALVDLLERAGPYGSGNPEPRFVVVGARIVRADIVGTGHIRCIVAGGDGARLKGIAFRSRDTPLGRALLGTGGALLHLAGHLRADTWKQRRDVQLQIEDAAPARPQS